MARVTNRANNRANNRRGKGEGNIRKKANGQYEARLTLDNGERKSLYGRTYEEARRKLAAAIRERDDGLLLLGDARQTVARYLANWLHVVQTTVSAGTYEQYESRVRVHIVPAIGRVRLSELTPQHVQHLQASMLHAGLAPNTVKATRTTLIRALNEAMTQGMLARNVATLTRAPKVRRAEMRVYDDAQVRRLLAVAAETRHEAIITLAVTTGMREGELLALTWRNVSLDGRYLQVQRNLRRLRETGLTMQDTKTAYSRRKIDLSELAVDALRRHRARQNAERLRAGDAWHDHDLVFPNTLGKPEAANSLVYRDYVPIVKRAGLPYIHFHDLRHTAATLLLLKNINPKKVSEMLGHANVAITLSLYSHVLPTMQRDAAQAMDELLNAPPEPPAAPSTAPSTAPRGTIRG